MILPKFLAYLKTQRGASAHTIHHYSRDLKEFSRFVQIQFPELMRQVSFGLESSSRNRGSMVELSENGPPTSRGRQSFEGESEPRWEKITTPVVRGFIASLFKKNKSSSITRKLSTLKSFYHYCVKQDYVPANPVKSIASPKLPQRLPRFLSVDEAFGLIEEVKKTKDGKSKKRDELILELLYGCGLRVSELVSLNVSDMQNSDRMLRVKGKGNKERMVPIGEKAWSVLQEYLAGRGEAFFLFKERKKA